MPVPKGQRYGGRQKGTENKRTRSIRAAIIEVFNDIGGIRHFAAWAKKNPDDFYKLCGRLIPIEVSGPDGGPIEIKGTLSQAVDEANSKNGISKSGRSRS